MPDASTFRAEHDSLADYLLLATSPAERARPLIPSFSHWEFATTTVGEIATTFHSLRSEVTVALWGNHTPVHDVSWTTDERIARLGVSPSRVTRLKRALASCGIPDTSFASPPIHRWHPAQELPQIGPLNRSGIRELKYRGASVGRAILQVHPDDDTPITDEHLWPREWVETSLRSFAWAFDQICALIEQRRSSLVVVFNGRFLHDAAALAAAEANDLPVLSYDFGGNETDFDLTRDPTHDWSALQQRMLTMFESWDEAERQAVGSSWFEERRHHSDPRNAKFVESQRRGNSLDIDSSGPLIVFFSSSGDEVSELDLDWSEYFYGQSGALQAVVSAVRQIPNATLAVRTHPHLRHKPRKDVEEWHRDVEQAQPHVHVDEFSDIDSYTLMDQADVVVTYGSTTGVEAAYAGKSVIVMGPSAYDELGCVTRVTSQDELLRALIERPVGSQDGALAYGLMMNRRGFRNEFVATSDTGMVLGGVTLEDSRPLVLHVSNILKNRQLRKRRR